MNTYQYWQEIEEVIDKALSLEKELREGYIRETCSHNTDLLEEALDYYSFIKKANETKFLESGSQKYSDLLLDPENDIEQNVIGTTIGPYQVTSLIGEGGMGSVYLAERIDGGFNQKVAIKFLRGGFFSSYMRKRFNNEKRILSKLNHPNISRLLDGGITGDGTPYLTMEYVDGLPVDEFCNTNNLDVKDRLDIFLQLCEAVQFAHSKLIIHRDLKPQNILVTSDGLVKVMDFGIAKFLNPEDEVPLHTRKGQIIASFNYASPEQLRSEDQTIATDVYGLGALLYLLLTGQPPHRFEDSSISEIESVIRDKIPVRPGQISRKEIGMIPSDLEAVIMKALRKEAADRYSSVQNFSADIHRFLNKNPVHAKDRSTIYKIKKFIARNRAPLGTAVLVLFTAIGFLLYHINAMNQQVERAEYEAETAEAVTGFMVDLFGASDPLANVDSTLTAGDLLARGSERFDGISVQPEAEIKLISALADANSKIGDYKKAEELYLQVDSITALHFEKNGFEMAKSALQLGSLYNRKNSHQQSENYLEKAARYFSKRAYQYPREFSLLYNHLGEIYLETGRADSSLIYFQKSKESYYNRVGSHGFPSEILNNQARAYRVMENYDEAQKIYTQILDSVGSNPEQNISTYLATLNNLAYLFTMQENYTEAETYYKKSIEKSEHIYGVDHPKTKRKKTNLVHPLVEQEKFEEAISLVMEQLDYNVRDHGKQSWQTAGSYSALGRILYIKGNFSESIRNYTKSHDIYENVLGKDHSWTLICRLSLAISLMNSGETDGDTAKLIRTVTDIKSALDSFSYQSLKRLEVAIEYAENYGHVDLHENLSELKLALAQVL